MANVKERCPKCGGTGTHPYSISNEHGSEDGSPCDQCEGTGAFVSKVVDTEDIEDKLNDILDKCNDIFEKLNE